MLESCSAIRSLMSGIPFRIKGRRLIAMLQCFVDDSGSDEKRDGLFVLAGYVMEEARWEDFAERWDAELNKEPRIRFFHMADAESGHGEFLGIDLPFRKMKVRSLAKVVEKCYPPALVVKMKWSDYAEIVKDNVDPHLDNPYAFLFFKILGANAYLQKQFNQLADFGFKPVDFIFDDQHAPGLKCLDWYSSLKQRASEPDRTIISNTPQFKDDRAITPLQAADMLAWHVRREFAFPDEDRSEVFGMLRAAGGMSYTYAPKELRAIVEAWNTRLDRSTI